MSLWNIFCLARMVTEFLCIDTSIDEVIQWSFVDGWGTTVSDKDFALYFSATLSFLNLNAPQDMHGFFPLIGKGEFFPSQMGTISLYPKVDNIQKRDFSVEHGAMPL